MDERQFRKHGTARFCDRQTKIALRSVRSHFKGSPAALLGTLGTSRVGRAVTNVPFYSFGESLPLGPEATRSASKRVAAEIMTLEVYQ